jgi:hypothetical protein
MAQSVNIYGNVGVFGNNNARSNIAASSGEISQTIGAGSLVALAAEINGRVGQSTVARIPELKESLDSLEWEASKDHPDHTQLRSVLGAIKNAAGKITDKFIQAGVKALVDRALDSYP